MAKQSATVAKSDEEEQVGEELVGSLVVEAEVPPMTVTASESAVVQMLVEEYPPPPNQKSETLETIAQVIAAVNIDLDRFDATAGPTADERAKFVASDPFASAKSFHFIINTLLEVVFGI